MKAGLEFRFAPGWHGYWRTPGDAGLPPSIDWSGSDNIVRGEIAWPAPTRLVVQGLQNGVYVGHVVLPATLALERPSQAATLHASVGYAACSTVCVPFQADLSLSLPAGAAASSPEAPLIAAAVAQIPGSPDRAGFEVVVRAWIGSVPWRRWWSTSGAGQRPSALRTFSWRVTDRAFPGRRRWTSGRAVGQPA